MATSSPTKMGLALAFLIAAAAFGAAAAAAAGEKTKTAAVAASGQEPMVKLEIPLFKSKKGLVSAYYHEMSLCDNPDDLYYLRESMEGIQDVLDNWEWRGAAAAEDEEEQDPVPWAPEGAATDGGKE